MNTDTTNQPLGTMPVGQTPPAGSVVPPFQSAPGAMPQSTVTVSSSFGAQPMTPPTPVPGSASWGAQPAAMPSTPPAAPTTSWTPPPPPPPASMPTGSSTPDFKPESEGKSKLPLLIAGILLILAMAGGYFLYMLYQTPSATTMPPVVAVPVPSAMPSPTMTEEEAAQKDIQNLQNVSTSDEVDAIQKDVNNTNLSSLDQ